MTGLDSRIGENKIYEPPLKTIEKLNLSGLSVYHRLKLFPWWVQFHQGRTIESELCRNIIEIGVEMGMKEKWLKKILRHTISEFSKNGLGNDYVGYHNIQHELEASYFMLLSMDGLNKSQRYVFSQQDVYYMFIAALVHDYDPLKQFDKPNEDCVEFFIRNDIKLNKLIKEICLDLDIVMALVHRTAYPFEGQIAQHARININKLVNKARLNGNECHSIEKIEELGWLLSVSERVAGYALGGIDNARDLARRNAHALGWHPSVINKNSVKFFDYLMNTEKETFALVIGSVPEAFKKNFFENVSNFKKAWIKELELRDIKKGAKVIFVAENCNKNLSELTVNGLLALYSSVPTLIQIKKEQFIESIFDSESIIVSARLEEPAGQLIGFAKGGPLEKYSLRTGTIDKYYGYDNTVYLEGINVTEGYWGSTCGHLMRIKFLNVAIQHGYKYLTGYAHRNVIHQRSKKLELIETVKKYDPDMLDYYRINLKNPLYEKTLTDIYE